MLRIVIQRLQQWVFVLWAVSVFAFLLIHLSGDPVRALLPLDATQEDMDSLRKQFGLDRPLPVQYLYFLRQLSKGDLGRSFKYRTDALPLIVQKLPATFTLAIASLSLAVIIAIPLGVLLATTKSSVLNHLAEFTLVLPISIPSFWLGITLILVFADRLRWLPSSGRGGWQHLVLPAITLSAYPIGLITRLVRVSVLEEMTQSYVVTARSKGLAKAEVLFKHVLKNALIPTVTVVGLQFGMLLGGAIVVETVFAWPGVGWLMIQAIRGRDLPLIRAEVLILASCFVFINLIIDILYGFLDPRIRISK